MSNNIIALAGKGGAGKSTIAVNPELALTHAGESTVLVETNIIRPSTSLLFGTAKLPHQIQDALANKCTPQETIYQHPTGLRFVPASIAAEKAHAQLLRMPELLIQYKTQAHNIILDAPVGLSTDALHLLCNAKNSFVPVMPDKLNMTEGLRIRHPITNVRGMILNKSTNSLSEKFFNAPFLASLPEAQTILNATQIGQPFAQLLPEHNFATRINKLVQKCLRL
ncbi:MAG: P-loop NTPase [Candidatus Woesearchaeota archaeon]|nr:P-loop NTPase [Candidatus Woesearchaeota archaeon]